MKYTVKCLKIYGEGLQNVYLFSAQLLRVWIREELLSCHTNCETGALKTRSDNFMVKVKCKLTRLSLKCFVSINVHSVRAQLVSECGICVLATLLNSGFMC